MPRGKIKITGSFGSGNDNSTPGQKKPPGNGSPSPDGSPASSTTPTAQDNQTQSGASGPPSYTVTVTVVMEPDPSAAFYLQRARNYAFDDQWDLGVNSNGLLNSGKTTVTDETPQIIATTASLVSEAFFPHPAGGSISGRAGLEGGLAYLYADLQADVGRLPKDAMVSTALFQKLIASRLTLDKKDEQTYKALVSGETMSVQQVIEALKILHPNGLTFESDPADTFLKAFYVLKKGDQLKSPKPFTVLFDPDAEPGSEAHTKNEPSWQRMAENCGVEITVTPTPVPQFASMIASEGNTKETPKNFTSTDGIRFRPPKVYEIHITPASSDYNCNIAMNQRVVLPDKDNMFIADYSRMALVKKTVNITFTNGMLTDYSETTDSPIVGFLSIPKSIIEAILPIPSIGGNKTSTAPTTKRAATTKSSSL